MSLTIMAMLPSDRVDLKRLVRLGSPGQVVDDHIGRYRCPVEEVAAKRIRDCGGDRRRPGALRRLSDTLDADRVLRIGLVDGTDADLRRHVEIARWLGLIEQGGGRQTELGI